MNEERLNHVSYLSSCKRKKKCPWSSQLEYEDLDAEAFGSYLKFLYAGALPFESTDDDECPLVYRPFIPLEPLEEESDFVFCHRYCKTQPKL